MDKENSQVDLMAQKSEELTKILDDLGFPVHVAGFKRNVEIQRVETDDDSISFGISRVVYEVPLTFEED